MKMENLNHAEKNWLDFSYWNSDRRLVTRFVNNDRLSIGGKYSADIRSGGFGSDSRSRYAMAQRKSRHAVRCERLREHRCKYSIRQSRDFRPGICRFICAILAKRCEKVSCTMIIHFHVEKCQQIFQILNNLEGWMSVMLSQRYYSNS